MGRRGTGRPSARAAAPRTELCPLFGISCSRRRPTTFRRFVAGASGGPSTSCRDSSPSASWHGVLVIEKEAAINLRLTRGSLAISHGSPMGDEASSGQVSGYTVFPFRCHLHRKACMRIRRE